MKLKIGDCVKTRIGTEDPELGQDISGWIGRIEELDHVEDNITFCYIAWDSITLAEMDLELIITCEKKSMEWSHLYLLNKELEKVIARDTIQQTEEVRTFISKRAQKELDQQ